MSNLIRHQGVVERIDGSHVVVRFVQSSACSGCHAQGYCSVADHKEKTVDIEIPYGAQYHVGQEVQITATTGMGLKAVWVGFVIPLMLLLLTLFVAMRATGGHAGFSALIALCMIGLYYLLIYLNRKKIDSKFRFTLRPLAE